jgi:hypothetical protein
MGNLQETLGDESARRKPTGYEALVVATEALTELKKRSYTHVYNDIMDSLDISDEYFSDVVETILRDVMPICNTCANGEVANG